MSYHQWIQWISFLAAFHTSPNTVKVVRADIDLQTGKPVITLRAHSQV